MEHPGRAGPTVGVAEAGEVSKKRQQLFEEREALSELESRLVRSTMTAVI